MASHETEEPKDAMEIIHPELYKLIVRRAAHDHQWAEYFLLINTCYEIIKQVPTTLEACNQTNINDLLEKTLEQIGKVIWDVLPGGANEFSYYMPPYNFIDE
jgi:hypothetical protein